MILLSRESYRALADYWNAKQTYQAAFLLGHPRQAEFLREMKEARMRLYRLGVIRRYGDDPPVMEEVELDPEYET